ncbi:hypothetical protein [Oceanicola sp. 22II-s10i]|nr:hypothetical protein [Oceanicola sp. 22II-s10i]
MFFVIRWLFFLAVLLGVALVAYAYLGPWFGVDFTPPQTEIRTPVILDVN